MGLYSVQGAVKELVDHRLECCGWCLVVANGLGMVMYELGRKEKMV